MHTYIDSTGVKVASNFLFNTKANEHLSPKCQTVAYSHSKLTQIATVHSSPSLSVIISHHNHNKPTGFTCMFVRMQTQTFPLQLDKNM